MSKIVLVLVFALISGCIDPVLGQVQPINDTGNEIDRKSHSVWRQNAYLKNVAIVDPVDPFGTLLVGEINPDYQIDAIYGLREGIATEIFTSGTGATAAVVDTGGGQEFRVGSGTSIGGYGIIRSRETLRYRAGQGIVARYTARFAEPTTNHLQRAGFIGIGNEISFGYNGGTDFGAFYRKGGQQHIETLTINTPAGGAETLTITLNSVAYNISVTSGTAAQNAAQIQTNWNASTSGWDASQINNTLVFTSRSIGNLSAGTYSISSTGSLAGSFSRVGDGTAPIDQFIPQSSFNIDKLDGTGPTGMVIDPQKGNVYQIHHQYLGYGNTTFFVLNPQSGRFEAVHQIRYPNENTTPNMGIPLFKIGWFSASAGSTENLYVYGASAAAFVVGPQIDVQPPRGKAASKTGVGTNFTPVISLRNRTVFDSINNAQEININSVSVSVEGTKTAEVVVYKSPVLTGFNWQYFEQDQSIALIDTSATAATLSGNGSIQIANYSLSKSGSVEIDFDKTSVNLQRNEILTVAVKASSGTTDATVAINWSEN